MLELLSFCDREREYPPSLKITVLTFTVKKSKKKKTFRGVYIFRIREKTLKLLAVVLVLKS